jgi:hypothetical protein
MSPSRLVCYPFAIKFVAEAGQCVLSAKETVNAGDLRYGGRSRYQAANARGTRLEKHSARFSNLISPIDKKYVKTNVVMLLLNQSQISADEIGILTLHPQINHRRSSLNHIRQVDWQQRVLLYDMIAGNRLHSTPTIIILHHDEILI